MPPYNIEVSTSPSAGRRSDPLGGDAISDSLNNRHQFNHRHQAQAQPMSMPMSSSPRRATTTAYNNAGKAPVAQRTRPPSDMPSTSSSGSWAAGAGMFPRSHPRNKQQQPPQSSASVMGSVSGSIHPHIRELIERQQLREQHQQQHQQQQQRPAYHDPQGPSKEDANVIHGLHMDHVLNNQFPNEGAGNPYDDDFVKQHALSVPFDQAAPSAMGSSPLGSPYNNQQQHLSPNNKNQDNDYVIEGTFNNKGCVGQTADDVGYLFGCGTHPEDEVVYVYNTNGTKEKEAPPALADERNLWYHQGPTGEPLGGGGPPGGPGASNNGAATNVNAVLFQIDKEYQAMQAHHEGNMLGTSTHNEFLRDPPPGTTIRNDAGIGPSPHGHYRVVQEDDEYTKNTSCSLSSLMDLILPSCNNQTNRSRGPGSSPRNRGCFGNYSNYPSDRQGERDGSSSRYPTGLLCSTSRNRQAPPPPNPASSSESNNSDNNINATSSFDKLKELKSQLKAMVHDRATRSQRAQQDGSPGASKEETRQEPTPPVSPKAPSEEKDLKDPLSPSEKEVKVLRQEQQSLDQARRMLQLELAVHEQKLATMNNYGATTAAMMPGMGMGMVGSPILSPMGMGVGAPSQLSPLTGVGSMMMNGVPMQQQPMQHMNGMGMNNMGMNGMGMNNGMMSPQQQVSPQGMQMNNGMMGNNTMNNGMMGMHQNAMNMMQNNGMMGTATHQPPQQAVPQQVMQQAPTDANSVMNSVMENSTMNKSIFSGGLRLEGKFIDNVAGGGYPVRPRVSPNKASRPSPSSSRPAPYGSRQPQGAPSVQSNNEEFAQSHQRLNDLKIKNALIRQDISRMKHCMTGNDDNKMNSPRSGGINVAAGMRVGPTKSSAAYQSKQQQQQPTSRLFPRTSPPSSPNRKHFEMQGQDPIARAMQRSDDARSHRGSNGSVASGYPQQHRSHQHKQHSKWTPDQHHQQHRSNQDGQRGGRQGGYSKRQPPSPIRASRESDQIFYAV